MAQVNYDHERNLHSLEGAERGMSFLASRYKFNSLLDVGAGTGTWLRAAISQGKIDVRGIDGVPTDARKLWVDSSLFSEVDFRKRFDLGRRFDAALCLEVAEHLPPDCAETLIQSLCSHADLIFFSAAVPGQGGDHHVNCQWPTYWQSKFNQVGFVCADEIRPHIWDDQNIEPWYRQNMFIARRDPDRAAMEPRILSLLHPEMCDVERISNELRDYQLGAKSPKLYVKGLLRSVYRQLK